MPRYHRLTALILFILFADLQGYSQTTGPGCTTPYYKGGYGPPLDGNISLRSTAVGPDGCIYIGNMYNSVYSIIKLDTFGTIIRSTAYTPPGPLNLSLPGKTIIDYDGKLLSVLFNNYILRTDTLGNILAARQLLLSGMSSFNFLDVGVLSDGDKVFLLNGDLGGSEDIFLVVTSPDLSTVKWTKYLAGWNYTYSNPGMVIDGDKIVLGFDLYGSYYYPNGSGIIKLDGGSGAVLQQRWFSQILNFTQVSSYNKGYIFNGRTNDPNFPSFYFRTDKDLNLLAAYDFPAYSTGYPYGYPFLFQPQPDGSIFGFYSSTSTMTLFEISPDDLIQWASGLFGFYQDPRTLALTPGGIFIGTDFLANDVITGGPLSGIQLYKSSYSGYFPPCTNPTTAVMSMTSYPLTPATALEPVRDTTAFSISNASVQETTGPTLVGTTCTGTPTCNSLKITGNAALCSDNGSFTGALNTGCSVPLSWSVPDGPGAAAITVNSNNTVSIHFSKDGAYKVKAMFSANCTIYADSMLVHVTSTTSHLSLGDDTTLCASASLLLRAGNNFSSYNWQDGSTDSNLLVTTPGQYAVTTLDGCGGTYHSSVNVSYRPPLISPFPTDFTKCQSDTLSLALPAGFDSVYFATSPADGRIRHDSVLFYDQSMSTYALSEIDDYGCHVNSGITVHIYPQPVLSIGNDVILCPGDSLVLDPGPGLDNYQWNTGSRSETIWAHTAGTYQVRTTTANGCIAGASMSLSNYPAPVAGLDHDTTLCTGTTRQLSANSGYISYLWNNDSTTSSISVKTPGLYILQVTDKNGCVGADSILLTGKQCLIGCYVPNAFTPNNDGKNDTFRPLLYGNVVHYKFTVFNRWGQQVFQSAEPGKGWDGSIQGVLQPAGTFAWYCTYQLQDEPPQQQNGTVLLIR